MINQIEKVGVWFVVAFCVVAWVCMAGGIKQTYRGGDLTIALAPSADNTTVGSWTVTEGSDVFDELDDPASADASGDHDSDGSTARLTFTNDGRVVMDVENSTAYVGNDKTINWVGLRWVAKRGNGISGYTGFADIGVALTPGGDYLLYDIDSDTLQYLGTTYDTTVTYEPPGSGLSGTAAVWTTDPYTGVAWTAAGVDGIQLYIDEDGQSNADSDIIHTELQVLVSISNKYAVPPVTLQRRAGDD